MDRILYTKYSTERKSDLRIKTCIMNGDDGKYIVKKPMTMSARKHIDSIYHSYMELSDLYSKSGININACNRCEEGIQFDYIEGITLEEKMDEALEQQDYLSIIEMIKEYKARLLDHVEHKKFNVSKDFLNVFGNIEIPNCCDSMKVTDIDMIFGNIIIDSTGKWNIIDYEWTFNFEIPVNYVLYRAICDYLFRSNKRDEIWHLNLLQLFGISEEEKKLYDSMDQAFHRYVNGDTCSLGTLNYQINNTKYVVKDLLVRYIPGQVQVFYDYGDGYSEEHSEFINCQKAEDGMYSLRIENLNQVKSVRVDPTNQYCIIDIRTFCLIERDGNREAVFYNNGEHIGDTMYVYNTDDPQWVVPDITDDIKAIQVDFYITNISKEIAGICVQDSVAVYNSNLELKQLCAQQEMAITDDKRQLEEKEQQICEKEQQIHEKEQKICEKDQQISKLQSDIQLYMTEATQAQQVIQAMENSTSWKLTKPVRILGKLKR